MLAGCVLAVTGVLGLTPPPRAAALPAVAAATRGRAVWTQSGGMSAVIAVAPARAGMNRIAATLERPARAVWVELRMAEGGVAAIRRPMRLEAGDWVQDGPELAVPGRWTLRIEALVSDFEQTTFTTEMEIR